MGAAKRQLLDVIKRVRVELQQIKKELPKGMTGEMAYDATAYINDAIHEVVKTLIDTLLIVMLVIFLFLARSDLSSSRLSRFRSR
jgi:multidrug efflux pump